MFERFGRQCDRVWEAHKMAICHSGAGVFIVLFLGFIINASIESRRAYREKILSEGRFAHDHHKLPSTANPYFGKPDEAKIWLEGWTSVRD